MAKRISLVDFQVVKRLGVRDVFLVRHKEHHKVQKVLKQFCGATWVKAANREIEMLTKVKGLGLPVIQMETSCEGKWHIQENPKRPNVFYYVYGDEPVKHIFLPFFEKGDLFSAIQDNVLTVQEMIDVYEQLIHLIRDLEAHKIIHHDIKPENILLSLDAFGKLRITLTDFGLSRSFSTDRPLVHFQGTPMYSAPEVLWMMVTGQNHIVLTNKDGEEPDPMELWRAFFDEKNRPKRLGHISGSLASVVPAFVELMPKLLKVLIKDRLTMAQTLEEINKLKSSLVCVSKE